MGPSQGDTIAIAALVVAICSATLSLAAVLWQFALYRLSGARLKVQIVFCYAEDSIRTWSVNQTRRPIRFADISFDHPQRTGIEYGRVRVTNIGRTAVSVENISFDLAPQRRWKVRRHRTTLQPFQFRRKDADDDSRSKELDLASPIRLEPGANVTAEFYLWPTLANPEVGTGAGDVVVRGSAMACGRKSAARSSRRTSWRLSADAWTMFEDVEVTPELRAFRELWHYNSRYQSTATSLALMMHRELNEVLAAGATEEELRAKLDTYGERLEDEKWVYGLLAYDVHHAYHHDRPALWPEVSERAPRRLRWSRKSSAPEQQ